MFAYEQCLLVLAYYPDVWYEATDYMSETSKLLQKNGVRFKRNIYKVSDVVTVCCEIMIKNKYVILICKMLMVSVLTLLC